VRQLVIDLERVAVGVGEIKAALIDVVGGPQDLDPTADEVSVRLTSGRIAADLKCDVAKPDLPVLRALRCLGRRMLTDVERVKVVAQCHEHATVLRVLLGDHKAEQVSVEALRDLLIGDPQIDVANTFNLIMALFDLSTKDTAKVMRPAPAPQARRCGA